MQTWQSLKLHQDQGIMTNEIQSWQTSSPLHILICPCKPWRVEELNVGVVEERAILEQLWCRHGGAAHRLEGRRHGASWQPKPLR